MRKPRKSHTGIYTSGLYDHLRYCARITIYGEIFHLGTFRTEEEALAARDAALVQKQFVLRDGPLKADEHLAELTEGPLVDAWTRRINRQLRGRIRQQDPKTYDAAKRKEHYLARAKDPNKRKRPKGVIWVASVERWQPWISIYGYQLSLGLYDTAEEAESIRQEAEKDKRFLTDGQCGFNSGRGEFHARLRLLGGPIERAVQKKLARGVDIVKTRA